MEGLKGMCIFLREEDLVDPERKEIKSMMLKFGVGEWKDLRKKERSCSSRVIMRGSRFKADSRDL